MKATLASVTLALVAALAPAAHAGELELVSVSSRERPANATTFAPDVTADGRKVVFQTTADNLARKSASQVLLRDLRTGKTKVVSRSSRGRIGNLGSHSIRISPNGRFVAFCSFADNLAKPDRFVQRYPPSENERFIDVFVRDLRRGITRRASTTHDGEMANDTSCNPHVANDGDVAFDSIARDLVPRDRDRYSDVFLYDWTTRKIRMISLDTRGRPVVDSAYASGISADSRIVSFNGSAEQHAGKSGFDVAATMLYLRGRNRIVFTRNPRGIGDQGSCNGAHPHEQLSASGRFLVLSCWHAWSDPAEGTVYGAQHLYRFDRHKKSYQRLTPLSLHESNAGPVYGFYVDPSGRYVAWCTETTYSEAERGENDFFIRDVRRRRPQRAVDHEWMSSDGICHTALPRGGRKVVLSTNYPLVAKDRNGTQDVYLARAPFYRG